VIYVYGPDKFVMVWRVCGRTAFLDSASAASRLPRGAVLCAGPLRPLR
jgi:hypothetical protein